MAHTVVLSWTASTDSVDGYNVYRGTSPGAENTLLNPSPITTTTFTDTTPTDGEFFYVVRSVKGGVESVNSNESIARILPAPPTALTVVSIT
jgi:hypothetical protein